MTALPAPLTPPNCDLQDFPRMMIDITRLRQSDFDAIIDDTAWRAGINLWLSAWHGDPAGSLTDEDTALAKAAGLGRDLRTWRKIKADALRGFITCSDGRLYHVTVCEFALEAWLEKLVQRLSSGAGNAKRWGADFDPAAIEAEIDAAADMLAALNPQSRAIAKAKRRHSRRDPDGNPDGTNKPSHRESRRTDISSQGKGTGKGIEEDLLANANVDRQPVDEAVRAWNDAAEAAGWPTVQRMPDGRRKLLRDRLKSEGLDGWRAALQRARASGLLGSDPPTWFTFDWLIKAANFTKLMDGNYGRSHRNGNGGSPAPNGLRGHRPDPALDMLREADADLAAEAAGRSAEADWRAGSSLPAVRSG